MRIGIMGAMPEEVDSIHELMTETKSTQHGNRTYHQGRIHDIEVVLVFSRWGKVAASSTVTSLITEFDVDHIILTGVAGATDASLNIGDIVIAKELYQHDMDPSPLFPKYEIPLTGETFLTTDKGLRSHAQRASEGLIEIVTETIPMASLQEFHSEHPKYITGTIASGDQFISNTAQTQSIMTDMPNTAAVEMEGAAIAQVCADYKIPFVVIRTISDKANHEAHIDFPKFIRDIARHYSKFMIEHMLRNIASEQTDHQLATEAEPAV